MPSFLDSLLQSVEAENIRTSGPFHIRPVVVDANALVSDVYYAAAHGHSALLDAAGLGVVRLFAPMHIYWKVHQKMPLMAYGSRAELFDEARRLWNSSYLDLVRFVDLRDTAIEDVRIQAVATRDQEDEPVAKLAALLSPCILLSQDKHLDGLGLGGADWRPLAKAGRDAMMPTQATIAGSIPVSLVASGVNSAVDLLRQRPQWRLPTALIVLAILGFVGWRLSKADRSTWGDSLNRMAKDAGEALAPLVERYQQAKEVLRQGTVLSTSIDDPLNRIAFALAISPRPMLMGEISRMLFSQYEPLSMSARQIGQVLRDHACFKRNRHGTWQVGFQAAPYVAQPVLLEATYADPA